MKNVKKKKIKGKKIREEKNNVCESTRINDHDGDGKIIIRGKSRFANTDGLPRKTVLARFGIVTISFDWQQRVQ
jgi:hypothetical protein